MAGGPAISVGWGERVAKLHPIKAPKEGVPRQSPGVSPRPLQAPVGMGGGGGTEKDRAGAPMQRAASFGTRCCPTLSRHCGELETSANRRDLVFQRLDRVERFPHSSNNASLTDSYVCVYLGALDQPRLPEPQPQPQPPNPRYPPLSCPQMLRGAEFQLQPVKPHQYGLRRMGHRTTCSSLKRFRLGNWQNENVGTDGAHTEMWISGTRLRWVNSLMKEESSTAVSPPFRLGKPA